MVSLTHRDSMHKWLLYSLGLFPIWILDAMVLNRYPLFGVSPMLLPLAVVAVAGMEGASAGACFGFGVGLWWALAYTGVAGWPIFTLTLIGLGVGAITQYTLSQSFPSFLLCSVGALTLLDGLRLLGSLFLQAAPPAALLMVAVSECLLTLAWSPVVYFIFRAVFRRVGGTRLA